EYDIRGTVGDQLTGEAAHAIGKAFATFAWERLGERRGSRAPRLAVGQDNRPSGEELAPQGASGTARAGGLGIAAGRVPTPGRYADAIVERNAPLGRRVKAVVDCGNGVTSLVAIETLRRLGAEVVPLFAESDGMFPNHHPDPTVLENLRDLQAAVPRERAELGIAFDGDGDRIGTVDEQGRVVFGDQLLVLLGRELVQRQVTGHPVIFAVKCSAVLLRELERAGLRPVMWKTGHSLIKQKMKELNAPLAGE